MNAPTCYCGKRMVLDGDMQQDTGTMAYWWYCDANHTGGDNYEPLTAAEYAALESARPVAVRGGNP